MKGGIRLKTLLTAKNIVKTFGEAQVLMNINLDINEGDFTIIMGASGSGKSTLLYVLSGMDRPTDGEVLYGDVDIAEASEKQLTKLRSKDFGFVFQLTYLVSNLSLYENALMAGYAAGMPKDQVHSRVNILMEKMNLVQAKDRLPSSVSGGEAQRAAVARAVIATPKILFADEPTGALNKANTKEVLDLLTSLNKEGQTVLMVTHDKSAALRGNRILYLEDGKIIAELNLSKYEGNSKEREEKLSAWLSELGW